MSVLDVVPRNDFGGLVVVAILAGIASGLLIRWLGHFSGNDPLYEAAGDARVLPSARITEYYAKAWRDRRRRMIVFKTVQISLFPMMLLLWLLSSRRPDRNDGVILALPAWFAAYMAAGVWLNRFRCPRCGKLYYWRLQLKGSMQRQARWRDCHYCGLRQDQCPSAVADL
jgi:hypothetical protein